MLFTMAVSLFTSRVILNTLGVEDYGIYNVVGRLVSMFSIECFYYEQGNETEFVVMKADNVV